MKFIRLLRREASISFAGLLLLAATAGLTNALILAVVNSAVIAVAHHASTWRYLVLFGVVMFASVMTRRYLRTAATSEVEAVVHKLRTRLAAKVAAADLRSIERMGRTEINAGLSKETAILSQSCGILVLAAQSGTVVLFTSLYIAWLSKLAFFLFLSVTVISLWIFLRRSQALEAELQTATVYENSLLDALGQILGGFKEVKLNARRGDELLLEVSGRSEKARVVKTDVGVEMAMLGIFSQSTMYVGVAAVVFILPQFSPTSFQELVKLTTAVLFVTSPVSSFIGSIFDLAEADVAADNVDLLEANLDAAAERLPPAEPLTLAREIALTGLTFQFEDQGDGDSFRVGPFDLALGAGSLTFIAGGNGTGKSTFLKLLTGLYPPRAGAITVDGKAAEPAGYAGYRGLFSAIFQDFFVFDRLYGLGAVDPARFDALLERMEIHHTVCVDNLASAAGQLSAGQKKRLALVVALLEDRPVYVFDEWAADQDPGFREKFYAELLPELKRQGKTVIAVTHDDRYFHLADRVFRMKDGLLFPEESGFPNRPAGRDGELHAGSG